MRLVKFFFLINKKMTVFNMPSYIFCNCRFRGKIFNLPFCNDTIPFPNSVINLEVE